MAHTNSDISSLLELSALFITDDNRKEVLEKILDTAINLASADMGNIQLFDEKTSSLKIMVHRGFDRPFLDFWNEVHKGQGTCGTTLESGRYVIVEDVTVSPIFKDSPALEVQQRAGIRAVLSIPLIGRSGKVIGVCSTHFARPHRPDDATLLLMELLARQATDIIERERYERNLVFKERLEALQSFIETAPASMAMFDKDMRYMAVSDKWIRDYHLEKSEIPGRSHYEIFPEISDRWKEVHRRSLNGEILRSDEDRFERIDGSIRWERWETKPWFNRDGEVGGIVIFTEDITEQKVVEDQLRIREADLRSILNAIPESLFLINSKGHVIDANKTFASRYGMTVDEITGKYILDFVSTELANTRKAFSRQAIKEKTRIRWNDVRDDRTFENSLYPVFDDTGGVEKLVIYSADISERKSAEKSLADSEQRYRVIVETSNEGIWAMDGQYQTTFVNQRMADMLGYPVEEMLGNSVEYFFFDEDLPEHRKNMELRRQGQDQSYERRFRRKDGSTLWTIVSATALKDDSGNFAGSFAMFTDITDKKRAEETLRENEQRYRLLAENTVDVIWQMDLDFRFTYVNQAVLKATGYTRDEWIGSRLSDYCDEETFSKMVQASSGLVSQGIDGPGAVFEAQMLKKDGQQFWAEIHARALFDDDRLPIGFQGVSRDVTERRNAQEKLRISENRFRTLLEGAPSGFWATDPLGKNTYVSPYWTELTGISREDALGDGWANGLHPDDRDKIFHGWLEAASKDKPYSTEFRFIHPDGRCVWVLCQASAVKTRDGSVQEWLGTITDITDRKIAEEALSDSEARYRGIFEGAAEGLLVIEQQSIRIKYGNRAMCDMLGYTLDELMDLGIPDIHPKDELDDIMAKFQLHQKGLRAKEEAIPVQRKDGSIRYVDISTTLMEINGTKCNVGFFWDVTERLLAEEALRESEKRYRAVVDNLQIGISVINPQMEVVAMNPYFGSYYPNVRPGTGQLCYSVYNDPPRSSPCSYCPCVGTFQDGKVHESETETPSGNQIRRFRIISCPVKDEHGEVQLVIELVEDITERRSLRSQLNQAQKMEAIGTLAGGVAHDFNNILQVIVGYSELIQNDERFPDVFRYDMIRMTEAAKRGAELVKRLLVFSRKTDFKPLPLDLNRRISDLRKMLERTIPKMINLKLSLSDNLLRINADPTQIDQVLMNLAVNARDAMPDGGKLTFETANICINTDMARLLSEAHTGQYVLLTVTDNGSGMSQQTMSHMFEPFFTTKSSGKGTGLGLSVVHGIVKQHEGFITCESEQGHGTRFNVYFPAIDSDVQIEDPETPVPALGGFETILLVDDDDVVRNLCQQVLEKANYKVIFATNGREALELYNQRKDEISLVLMDLMMPVMGGERCIKELLAINPSLKIIIISGYHGETTANDLVFTGAKTAIYKPFGPNEVLQVVKDVLGQQS